MILKKSQYAHIRLVCSCLSSLKEEKFEISMVEIVFFPLSQKGCLLLEICFRREVLEVWLKNTKASVILFYKRKQVFTKNSIDSFCVLLDQCVCMWQPQARI